MNGTRAAKGAFALLGRTIFGIFVLLLAGNACMPSPRLCPSHKRAPETDLAAHRRQITELFHLPSTRRPRLTQITHSRMPPDCHWPAWMLAHSGGTARVLFDLPRHSP